MKKTLTLLLALVMCLPLCACGTPSVDSCVQKADEIVNQHECTQGDAYGFRGEYFEDLGSYVIVMYVDKDLVDEVLENANEKYKEVIREMTIQNLDNAADTIKNELSNLYELVAPIFKKTDIQLRAAYYDRNGKVEFIDVERNEEQ